jgi:hypothetical protein
VTTVTKLVMENDLLYRLTPSPRKPHDSGRYDQPEVDAIAPAPP